MKFLPKKLDFFLETPNVTFTPSNFLKTHNKTPLRRLLGLPKYAWPNVQQRRKHISILNGIEPKNTEMSKPSESEKVSGTLHFSYRIDLTNLQRNLGVERVDFSFN